MAKLRIVKYGDEVLRKTCRPVDYYDAFGTKTGIAGWH